MKARRARTAAASHPRSSDKDVGQGSHRSTDTETETVEALMKAFMDSPKHRAIILDSSWNYMGAGVEKTSSYMWVTLLFTDKNPGTTLHSC